MAVLVHHEISFAPLALTIFSLSTMSQAEYMNMNMNMNDIPQDINSNFNLYNLKDKSERVHFKTTKGMYGLKQAAILVFD